MGLEDTDKLADNEFSSTEVEYPFEYFDAQVRFAKKWSELSGDTFEKSLIDKTALYRRIVGEIGSKKKQNQLWFKAVEQVSRKSDVTSASRLLYSTYLKQEHSKYVVPTHHEDDGKHFGSFGFDYFEHNRLNNGKNTVKIHFINTQRGEKSGLNKDFQFQRREDLKRMFNYIKEKYPDAEEVIGGSWLYALPGYRDSFPPKFIASMKRMVPDSFDSAIPDSVPHMSFTGNSVWGQFVNRSGGPRVDAYKKFIDGVNTSRTLVDLIEAFPMKTMQPKAPISVFYNWEP
ncbi:hypothetical protein HY086_01535 [Candidatus Gottesmanbacteria bacterium]|nr:hypothetical protein [Candidatus Gottesmanbacteria bacterium]